MKRVNHKLFLAMLAALSLCCACSANQAQAADKPEIASTVWDEGTNQCASVTLDGKDLIAFHSPVGGQTAEQRAEELADKLEGLLEDEKFDASKLVPAREGGLAVIKVDGITVLKFAADDTNSAESSLKLVNSLRSAYGSDSLPTNSANKVADAEAKPSAGGFHFSGPASWYGPHFHGKKCSDGSRFDMEKLTAAHRFLPFGTKLLVMNRKTGAKCVVKVNDRGPFVGNRVIDLSKGAARQLDMLGTGVAMVDCVVLGQ